MNTIGRCTHCLPSRFAGLSSRSRLAIERLGAIREGVHRHELQRRADSWRDSVHYSILRSEWPRAKRRLLARLVSSALSSWLKCVTMSYDTNWTSQGGVGVDRRGA
jgi:hypothetical protein